MRIHVVRPGESVYSISRLYDVPSQRIISDNELTDPEQLVPGQTLVILGEPDNIPSDRVIPSSELPDATM